VDLVRDVLDKLVLDRNGRTLGRVDGIALETHDGRPPTVDAIEIGPSVLGDRLHPTLGRCASALEVALGVAEGRPVRIPFGTVLQVTSVVKVDVAISDTAAGTVENWLRTWIARLPGGG
jgi:sporulation protein YlmC with PRC-barrel domain